MLMRNVVLTLPTLGLMAGRTVLLLVITMDDRLEPVIGYGRWR